MCASRERKPARVSASPEPEPRRTCSTEWRETGSGAAASCHRGARNLRWRRLERTIRARAQVGGYETWTHTPDTHTHTHTHTHPSARRSPLRAPSCARGNLSPRHAPAPSPRPRPRGDGRGGGDAAQGSDLRVGVSAPRGTILLPDTSAPPRKGPGSARGKPNQKNVWRVFGLVNPVS